ncbi:MAG: CpsB/CapC family capsule biosynthesis tyrosine phosphatase [Rikenellaceae bacterium]
MIFFGRKHSILKSPFFEGFKDYHNHTLPSVDDGVQGQDNALSVLSYLEELKFREVVLTPHVMVGVNNTDQKVESSFAALSAAYQGPIKLSLASEYMLDFNFEGHFKRGARLIEDTNILVETSYMSAPVNFDELLYEVKTTGITPIIAHPERYHYMSRDKYHVLKDQDYRFQLNILSFMGMYGGQVPATAIYLLEQGMYDIVGTDLHGLRSFSERIKRVKLSSKHIDMLLEVKSKGL